MLFVWRKKCHRSNLDKEMWHTNLWSFCFFDLNFNNDGILVSVQNSDSNGFFKVFYSYWIIWNWKYPQNHENGFYGLRFFCKYFTEKYDGIQVKSPNKSCSSFLAQRLGMTNNIDMYKTEAMFAVKPSVLLKNISFALIEIRTRTSQCDF